MGLLSLNSAEKKLCRQIVHGDLADFGKDDEVIDADVIRHIVVGLAIVKQGSEEWAGERPARGKAAKGVACPKTGIGIRIRGARIKGPLLLDAAINDEGGPICPLAFENCTFHEGISGRRSHFSRLSLAGCSFGDPKRVKGRSVPTIDLSGATITGELELAGIKPLPARKRNHLWMRAIGSRIQGNLDLSRARLRAPADNRNRLLGEPRIQPLDLSLANIEGDFLLLHGDVGGMISARGAHIRGDVWMSGTEIRCPRKDDMALFFQLATIGGSLMLDGGWKFAKRATRLPSGRDRFRSFFADGRLNLFGVRVGGSIVMNDARIESAEEACIDLTGARVGDRVEVGRKKKNVCAFIKGRIRLDRVTVGSFVLFEDVRLGSKASGTATCHCIDARSLVAKQFICSKIKPWVDGAARSRWDLSITLAEATLDQLRIEHSRMSGILVASPICCTGNVVLARTIGQRADLENARIGGTLDISGLHIEGKKAELSLRDATIGGALNLVPRNPKSTFKFRLFGTADLMGLSVDTLDDDIGRAWGGHVLIRMNHFSYRRTGGNQKSGEFRQSSWETVADWVQARFAEIKWPPTMSLKWARGGRFWRPWQLRRNWIYQQFDSFETRLAAADACLSPTRHKISEHQYSPQPFEQAIRVARAEGREDFATHFEIHKQRLEWRFVNRGVRWPLGFAAISFSSMWLISHAHSTQSAVLTFAALLLTVGLMLAGSSIRRVVRRWIVNILLRSPGEWMPWMAAVLLLLTPWLTGDGTKAWVYAVLGALIATIPLITLATLAGVALSMPKDAPPRSFERAKRVRATNSKILTWYLYWIPAALVFAITDWHIWPFHYFVGGAIFLVIRLTAVVAHMMMRFGFGYMRRPVFAVITLIAVFLIGWGGVILAKQREMFVVNIEPTAGLVASVDPGDVVTENAQARVAEASAEGHASAEHPQEFLLTGSEGATGGRFVRDVSCSHEISEPLYALDILIPIVDLGEERRCEIRRFARRGHEPVEPGRMKFGELWNAFPDLPLNDHRFWWWVKAIYAIFGWIIVSLAILTFAHVNKIHAELPTEHK